MDKIIPKLGDSLDLWYTQDPLLPHTERPFFSAAISVWCAKKIWTVFHIIKS